MVPLCLVPALVLLFFYVSTFRSMCAVPNMAVVCSSLTSWFPGMSLTYFRNDLEMVPVAPIYYYYYHHHHHHHHHNVNGFPYVVFSSLLLCTSISTPFTCVSAISLVCSVLLISSDLPTYIWIKERMSTVVRVHLDLLLCHLTYTALVFQVHPPALEQDSP